MNCRHMLTEDTHEYDIFAGKDLDEDLGDEKLTESDLSEDESEVLEEEE